MREIASPKLNMKVCGAIPGTLNVVSEENAAINENNRFTERFNFELAFNNLSLTLATGRVTLFLTTARSRFFCKIRVELNVFRAT